MAPLGNRRRRKKPSTIRQLISIVGGGVFGLGIGYFILLWVAGTDVMNLAPKLPAFMVPKKFHAGGVSKAKEADNTEPKFVRDMKEKNKFDFDDSGPGALPTNVKGSGFDPAKGPANNPANGNVPPKGNDSGADSNPGDEPDLSTPSLDPIDPLKLGAPTINEPKLPPAGTDPAESTEPAEPAPTEPLTAPVGEDTPANEDPAPAAEPAAEPATGGNDPVAEDAPPAGGAFLVSGRTEFTAEQLKEALDAATASQDALLQGSLDSPQFKKAKVAAYLKFCKLADTYTFTKLKSGDRKSEILKDAVKGMLLKMIESRLALPDIEKIGDQWLKRPTRSENGIVVVGTVLKVEKAGKVYATTIRCGATPEVVVLTTDRPFWKAPESIIALGTVVEDPPTNLVGYEGPATIAVFTSMVQPCN